MGLDPQAVALLREAPRRPRRDATVEDNRRSMHALRRFQGDPPALADVRDLTVETGETAVPTRLYMPKAQGTPGCVVYLHGGGWSLGDLDSHDAFCRDLAGLSGCAVLAVHYRRPPEHPFPAALDDTDAVVRWVLDRGDSIGVDPAAVAVAGDSAGGNLAAACCLRLRGRPAGPVHQLLILPVLDAHPERWPSYAEFADGPGMPADDMDWYFDLYLGPERRERDNPEVAPMQASDLRGLPPATVITAECDVLRDEGEAYAARLAESDVPVQTRRFAGMFHPFYLYAGALDAARDLETYAADRLRQALRPG